MHPEDRAQVEATSKKMKEHQEKLALAYGEIFRTKAGKLVLQDLKERCNVDNTTIRTPAKPDPYSVLFEEGKRAMWNYMMIYLRHDNERRKSE